MHIHYKFVNIYFFNLQLNIIIIKRCISLVHLMLRDILFLRLLTEFLAVQLQVTFVIYNYM